MTGIQNKDTRYFIDTDLNTLEVVGNGYDQKQKSG